MMGCAPLTHPMLYYALLIENYSEARPYEFQSIREPVSKDIKHDLERGIEANEGLSTYCGWAVVAGLLIEVILAIVYRRNLTWTENWAPVFADALVALGVYGEIHFAGNVSRAEEKLRRISNEAVAQANERASNADKLAAEARERAANVERLTEWRHITTEQRDKIADIVRASPVPIELLIEYERGDPEAYSYAAEILMAFGNAGATPRFGTNSLLATGHFGVFLASSLELSSGVSIALSEVELQHKILGIDLSTYLARGVPAPNLLIFVAPKPPPLLLPTAQSARPAN